LAVQSAQIAGLRFYKLLVEVESQQVATLWAGLGTMVSFIMIILLNVGIKILNAHASDRKLIKNDLCVGWDDSDIRLPHWHILDACEFFRLNSYANYMVFLSLLHYLQLVHGSKPTFVFISDES